MYNSMSPMQSIYIIMFSLFTQLCIRAFDTITTFFTVDAMHKLLITCFLTVLHFPSSKLRPRPLKAVPSPRSGWIWIECDVRHSHTSLHFVFVRAVSSLPSLDTNFKYIKDR